MSIDELFTKSEDVVNQPSHYTQGEIECIEAMKACASEEEFRGYLRLSHFKYNWRMKHKHEKPLEDAMKAQWYWNRLLKELGGNDE
tara:strand:- start:1075 stop:1332 length:258 start_codon:yes stop_codon:yes gene_type:complete